MRSISVELQLGRKGYKLLAEGTYGTVWYRPSYKRLIKLCPNARDGWPAYARFCMLNPAPWALKVYHLWQLETGETVAIVERCKGPLGGGEEADSDCWDYHYTVRRVLYGYKEGERIIEEMLPWLTRLRDFACGLFRFDLHTYNSLIRDDGSYVLSDPLSGMAHTAVTAEDIEQALRQSTARVV